MVGANVLTLNEATLKEAIEEYLNRQRLATAPQLRVTSVSQKTTAAGQFIVTVQTSESAKS
jgi:galactitol-specific phosphotransferase system IIB component